MIIVFATTSGKNSDGVLNALEIEHRLVSYWYVRGLGDDFVSQYVATGEYKSKGRRAAKRKVKRTKLLIEDRKPSKRLQLRMDDDDSEIRDLQEGD